MKKKKIKRLWDSYEFTGFKPTSSVVGIFGDQKSRVVSLIRSSKKLFVVAAKKSISHGTTNASEGCVTFPVVAVEFFWSSTSVV